MRPSGIVIQLPGGDLSPCIEQVPDRTEWYRIYALKKLSKFAKTLQKGQLITLEEVLRYREVVE